MIKDDLKYQIIQCSSAHFVIEHLNAKNAEAFPIPIFCLTTVTRIISYKGVSIFCALSILFLYVTVFN